MQIARPVEGANLYLVRAGRTSLSAEGRFAGWLDPPLDEAGIVQARRAVATLAAEGVVAVGTSPLRRARQTAGIIAQACAAKVDVLNGLTDVDVGTLAGMTREEASTASPEEFDLFFRFPASATPPGGERMWGALERVAEILESLTRRASGAVVAVTHELPSGWCS